MKALRIPLLMSAMALLLTSCGYNDIVEKDEAIGLRLFPSLIQQQVIHTHNLTCTYLPFVVFHNTVETHAAKTCTHSILFFIEGLGITSTIVEIYVCVYYNVILAWCLYYLWASFTSVLPWATCGNEWNTEHCADFTSSTTLSNSNIFNHILNHLVLFSEIYLHQS